MRRATRSTVPVPAVQGRTATPATVKAGDTVVFPHPALYGAPCVGTVHRTGGARCTVVAVQSSAGPAPATRIRRAAILRIL